MACLCGFSYLRQSHTLDGHPQVSTLPGASCRRSGRRRIRSPLCLRSRCGNTGHDAVRPLDGIGLRMVTPVGVSDCLFVLARCVSRSRTSCHGQKPPAVRVGRGQQSRPDRLSSASMMATPRMAGRYDHRRPRAKSGGHVRLPWRRSWRSARGPSSRTVPVRPPRARDAAPAAPLPGRGGPSRATSRVGSAPPLGATVVHLEAAIGREPGRSPARARAAARPIVAPPHPGGMRWGVGFVVAVRATLSPSSACGRCSSGCAVLL